MTGQPLTAKRETEIREWVGMRLQLNSSVGRDLLAALDACRRERDEARTLLLEAAQTRLSDARERDEAREKRDACVDERDDLREIREDLQRQLGEAREAADKLAEAAEAVTNARENDWTKAHDRLLEALSAYRGQRGQQ